MFVGTVLEIGDALRDKIDLQVGDRIASLVSLTLTPLHIEAIRSVDVATGRILVRGKAILFESGLWARLPADIDEGVALAVLDVAGAPAQVRRLCSPGQTVAIVGADGKSGLLSCAQAKARVGSEGRVIGIVPNASTPSARLLRRERLVDELIVADARNALDTSERVGASAPELAELVVNCVNVPGTELASILCARDGGIVYFFSMSTSFTAAALGAEGAGRDVTMIIGNGYTKGHADIALQTLRDNPALFAYFNATYATTRPELSKDREYHGHDHDDRNPSPQTCRNTRAVRVQEAQTRRVLAAHSGVRRDRRSDIPRPSLATAPIGQDGGRAASNDPRRLFANVLSQTPKPAFGKLRWRCAFLLMRFR